jgi:DNA mismatch endonuclease (patch repair protein)
LHLRNCRWAARSVKCSGKPGFCIPKIELAVFVDGSFWHACPSHSNMPVQNRKFWKAKLDSNRQRDRLVRRALESRGWRVLRMRMNLRESARVRRQRGPPGSGQKIFGSA